MSESLTVGARASIGSFRESFQNLPIDSQKIDALNGYVRQGDSIYVHKTTGVVSSDLKHTPEDIIDYWSSKIFTSTSTEDYSAYFPFARARLYYVARVIVDNILKKENISDPVSYCDFATGQGVLPDLIRREWPGLQIRCTEGSEVLVEKLRDSGFEASHCMLGDGKLPPFSVDIGTLTWTLCNCIRPLDVLMEVRKNIKDGGYMVLVDSSRILVPFRKSLRDLFNPKNPADVHPYLFSANSMCALLRCAGFKPVFINRYFDSDVLLVIGQKEDMLPSDDLVIPADNSGHVFDFFTKAHELTASFDSWNASSPSYSG